MPREQSSDVVGRKSLLAICAVTLCLWQFPTGQWVLYPFSLLASYVHELGHGVSALITGGRFDSLELHWDGSGLARIATDGGALSRAFVSAGGLLGPSVVGFALLFLSRTRASKVVVWAIPIAMVLSLVLWGRTLTTWLLVLSLAGALALVAQEGGRAASFGLQLFGAQLCLSIFHHVGYMFSSYALVGGARLPSDSQQIAEALLLPYWFWGSLTAAVGFGLLALGLYLALRPKQAVVPGRS